MRAEGQIANGDYVVIRPGSQADNGEKVVAMVDKAMTLKKFYKEGGKIRLQPANKSMEPRYVEPDRLRIQGVVIGVLRSYN